MRLPALLAAMGSLLVGPGLAHAGGHGGGGHGGGGGHPSAPHMAQPRFNMPKAPHVNMPRMPKVSRQMTPQYASQPRSYSSGRSHPVTHHTGQGKNTTASHVTQPGATTAAPAKSSAAAVSPSTKATPTPEAGLAAPTTPNGNTPVAISNPRPTSGPLAPLVTANRTSPTTTAPTTPITPVTPTTPVTPVARTTPGITPLGAMMIGGFGNPYGLGYGGGYGRGYGGRRGYGYGRGYGGYGNGNNSYYFVHMRAIARLANDLNGLSRGMTIATGRANRIRGDLMRVVYGGNAPPPAMVQQLAMDLTQILPSRTTPMMNTGQLARDLAVVMNGSRQYSMHVQTAVGRAHSVLRHAGVPQQGVQTLVGDMMSVASVGNMMNNQMAGGVF